MSRAFAPGPTRLAALLALFGLLASPAAAAGADEAALAPMAQRPPAPALALTDLDGRGHRLRDYRGRVVVVNFWATWCPPCREEMPSMERAWRQLQPQGVVLLGVNVGESEDQVWTFTGDYPVSFPLLLDRDGGVTGSWPVRGLPTTFVVDPQGRLAYRAIGGRAWDDPALIQTLLRLATPPAGPGGAP